MYPVSRYLALMRGLCRGADVSRAKPDPDGLVCEGCEKPATTEDCEGVPLCDECAAEMMRDAEEDERKRLKDKESQ
jgi:predicted amidophosphoribosyltransferase